MFTAVVLAIPAAGFDYDESTQGDIGTQGKKQGKPPRFNLDVGNNVIRGSTEFSTSANFDFDQFMIRIPKGTVLDLNSTVYEYTITDMFGDIRVVGASIGIGRGVPHHHSEPLYSTGDTHGPFFYLFNDGSIPELEVSPSPVSLQFFEVVNSAVDVNRPVSSLQSDDYWVAPGVTWTGLEDNGTSWDYSITLVVTPAP